ncbi:MAG: hypothetical protein MUP04_03070 [Anaerolineae bacterium]|nr:hypothetical protein [Anaerolineae bacterium]
MSTTRLIGLLLLVGGIVLLLLSLSADMIGLGRDPGFGYQQMGGTLVGAVAAIIGGLLYRRG